MIYYTDLQRVYRIDANGERSVAVPDVHTHELRLDDPGNLYGEDLEAWAAIAGAIAPHSSGASGPTVAFASMPEIMCTVSVMRLPGLLRLVSNRDERRTRPTGAGLIDSLQPPGIIDGRSPGP